MILAAERGDVPAIKVGQELCSGLALDVRRLCTGGFRGILRTCFGCVSVAHNPYIWRQFSWRLQGYLTGCPVLSMDGRRCRNCAYVLHTQVLYVPAHVLGVFITHHNFHLPSHMVPHMARFLFVWSQHHSGSRPRVRCALWREFGRKHPTATLHPRAPPQGADPDRLLQVLSDPYFPTPAIAEVKGS